MKISNEIDIDTTNLNGRLKYGLSNENNFLELLNDNGIYIEGNDNETDERFNWCDFRYSNDKINVFFELKSRTVSKNKYNTTILAVNKVKAFKRNKIKDKKNCYIIFFGFLEKNRLEYYYIQYDKTLFDTFDKCSIFDKDHYNIPISHLKDINDFYKMFQQMKLI